MVQIHPDPPITGAIAQLGERLPCTQEVRGSIPRSSTIFGAARHDGKAEEFADSSALALTRRYQVAMFFDNLKSVINKRHEHSLMKPAFAGEIEFSCSCRVCCIHVQRDM